MLVDSDYGTYYDRRRLLRLLVEVVSAGFSVILDLVVLLLFDRPFSLPLLPPLLVGLGLGGVGRARFRLGSPKESSTTSSPDRVLLLLARLVGTLFGVGVGDGALSTSDSASTARFFWLLEDRSLLSTLLDS